MSSSTIIQVSQANDNSNMTIRIDLTISDGKASMSMQQQPRQRPESSASSAQIEGLMRNMRSLNIDEEAEVVPGAPGGRWANKLLASVNAHPPPKLNFENRRKKKSATAAAASDVDRSQTEVIGIPDVPDAEEFESAHSHAANDADNDFGCCGGRRHSNHLIGKAPSKVFVPASSKNFAKLARSGVEGDNDDEDFMHELESGYDEIDDAALDEGFRAHRQRQLSSATTAASPYSSSISHVSASPPAFNDEQQQQQQPPKLGAELAISCKIEPSVAQQQPEKRKRGRPRKTDTAPAPSRTIQPKGQPILSPSNGLATSFFSNEELQAARRVIGNIDYTELIKLNDAGDLLIHRLAREGNWAKVVAVNQRLLNSQTFDDIYAGINAPGRTGRTVLLEAVEQRNAKAVAYCCLFTSSSDCSLLHALAEAAMLPVDDACDEIFLTILGNMCQDLDLNGNPITKASHGLINHPIGCWSWSSKNRSEYTGLTLLQLLTLQPPDRYARLTKLIECGANPMCKISSSATQLFRPYNDSCGLAARYSPDPLACFKAMGMTPRLIIPELKSTQLAFTWDTKCQVSHSCARIIDSRTDLPLQYRQMAIHSLSGPELLELDLCDVERLAPVDTITFRTLLENFTV